METQWLPEILHYSLDTPRLLLGNKCDVDAMEHQVTQEEAIAFAKKYHFVGYAAISATEKPEGVIVCLEQAVRYLLNANARHNTYVQKCTMM